MNNDSTREGGRAGLCRAEGRPCGYAVCPGAGRPCGYAVCPSAPAPSPALLGCRKQAEHASLRWCSNSASVACMQASSFASIFSACLPAWTSKRPSQKLADGDACPDICQPLIDSSSTSNRDQTKKKNHCLYCTVCVTNIKGWKLWSSYTYCLYNQY